MKPQIESKYIVKTVLAPEVRWEVVEGFPIVGFIRDSTESLISSHACSVILKIGAPNQRRLLKQATSAGASIQRARKAAAELSKPVSRTFGRCAMVSSFVFNSARTRCNSRKCSARISVTNKYLVN